MTAPSITLTGVPPAAKRLFAVVLLSAAAMLVTAWWAARAGLSGDAAVSVIRYPVWSALLAPLMVYAWLGHYLLHPARFISGSLQARRLLNMMTGLVALTAIYGAAGFVAANPIRYVAGDTYKYLLAPFGFYIAAVGIQSPGQALWLFRALAVFAYYPGLDVGSHVFSLSYLYGRKVVYWRRLSWLLVLPVVYWTISVNRTSLLLVPLLTVLLYYYARRLQVCRVLAASGVVAVGAWVLYLVAPQVITETDAYQKTLYMVRNLNLVDYRLLDLSTYQRIQEAVLIVRKFGEASWFEKLAGFGSGAVFEVSHLPLAQQQFYEDALGGYAHHIHISLAFVYHQWGLPGLLLLGYSTVALLAYGWGLARRRHEASDPERRESYALQMTAFMMALAFFLYGAWNPPKIALFYFGLLLGALWRLSGSRVEPFGNGG